MTNPALTDNVIRYGSDEPLPERLILRAGPVSAVLENGDLRYVRLGDVEIVRRLYVAIRDRNWDTIPPNYMTYRVHDEGDHFRVELAAEHVSADVDFAWSGSIEGSADGTIRYTLDGAPRNPFLRNRIGFCVLHPSDLAGVPARTETPEGPVEGRFPDLISPRQPFFDMQAITHPAGDNAKATIQFEGDLFEMEDQRNWTDASYKTYSTPLRIPYPVEVDPSSHIIQTVTISVSGTLPKASTVAESPMPSVTVDFNDTKPLPPIGFGAGLAGTISPDDMSRFRALEPAHLWENLDLGFDSWQDRLHEAADRATALNTSLDLSVVAAPGNTGWDALAQTVRDTEAPVGRVFAFPPVSEPVTFPRDDLATHPETLAAARQAFRATGSTAVIGGGARSYFTELNRAMSFLPGNDLDVVTYPLNPQVHASDNLSMIETLIAQGETVRSARALVPGTPLVVGPVTLAPPFNPNATGPEPETPEEQLPAPVDHRQLSLLGAGWTIGSIHRLAAAGADGLTYYELYGWRGLSERRADLTKRELFPSEPGQLFPLYHIFAAASDFAGGQIARVELSAPLRIEALALRDSDGEARILVASFAEESIDVALALPGISEATIRYLDESTYGNAINDLHFFRNGKDVLNLEGGKAAIHLFPFAIACIQGRTR
jgi:hypothetical protein